MPTAKTLASSSTLFLPIADFLNRVDHRSIGQLASDNNIPIAESSLASNGKVLAAVKDACGYVESAAYMGERYYKEDLEAIASTDCHARNMLYRLVSDQAVMLMIERRPDLDIKPTAGMMRSMEWLEQLVEGKRIFPFTEVAEAGRLDHEIDTAADVAERRLPSYTARLLFGTRNNRWYD